MQKKEDIKNTFFKDLFLTLFFAMVSSLLNAVEKKNHTL